MQVLVHCFGSLVFFAALLTGKLKGKIRCVVASQVAAFPIGSLVNRFKSNGCFGEILAKLGMKSITAYVDQDSPWNEKALNIMTRNFAKATTASDEICSSGVCHG